RAITRAAPRCSSTSVNPPVEAPTSRQSSPAGSTSSASSACASFSAPRETNRAGRSTASSAVSSTCSPALAWPGTSPARISACACARLSASPRSTSTTSRRFLAMSRGANGEAGDDLLEDGRVGADPGEVRLCPIGRLVGQLAGPLKAVCQDVPVRVEDVVHHLEQQAELVAEGAPRPLLALGEPCD